jgi:hypothetical protein
VTTANVRYRAYLKSKDCSGVFRAETTLGITNASHKSSTRNMKLPEDILP